MATTISETPFKAFGAFITEMKNTIPVEGKILNELELSTKARMSASTYRKLKVVRV